MNIVQIVAENLSIPQMRAHYYDRKVADALLSCPKFLSGAIEPHLRQTIIKNIIDNISNTQLPQDPYGQDTIKNFVKGTLSAAATIMRMAVTRSAELVNGLYGSTESVTSYRKLGLIKSSAQFYFDLRKAFKSAGFLSIAIAFITAGIISTER